MKVLVKEKIADTGALPADLRQSPDDRYLFVSCFGDNLLQQWDVSDPDGVLVQTIETYLQDHHGEPDLDPGRVASVHGLSVRRLHALFEPTGRSIAQRIRAERLAAIRRDLSDPRLAQRPIERIAALKACAIPPRSPGSSGRRKA